ncbi:MAG: S1C family serine protease, partial [Bdellovibrionota bacterium]
MRLLFAVSLFVTNSLVASAADMTSEQLYEKFKPAVVKINITQHGIAIGMGSGFFVSADGVVVTNKHVAGLGLAGQFRAEFVTSDGKVIKDFSVAKCSDTRGVDLCLMKLDVKPKSWFDVRKIDYKVGQQIYTIGHPKGFDFTISQGLISGVRRMTSSTYREDSGPNSVENVQINAPISPGNSGGPTFNAKGELIGVSTWFRAESDSKELNFTISSNEVADYIAKAPPFVTRKQYRESIDRKEKILLANLKKKIAEPAETVLAANEKAKANIKSLDPDIWGRLEIKTEDGNYSTFLPKSMLKSCREVVTPGKSHFLECKDTAEPGGIIQFRFKVSGNPRAELRALGGKTPEPVPFPIVESLMKTGEWEAISKKLTPTQKKYLFSVPSKFKCSEAQNAFYHPGTTTTYCTNNIFNDAEPDASSFTVSLARDGGPHVISVLGWGPGTPGGLYFYVAEVAAKLLTIPASVNPTVTAAITSEETDSLKKLLAFTRNSLMATKVEFGSYPRDLSKAVSDSDLERLSKPGFYYRVFVLPACARQSKPSDKTELTNITAAKRRSKTGPDKTAITRVDQAADKMA